MRNLLKTSAVVTAILASASCFSSAAQAMPVGIPSADGLSVTENVAVCFYLDGWNGPGLYECGFRRRHGLGWVGVREERREFRDERREGREFRDERREERREYRDDRRERRGERREERGER
ncbi:MAG TPA: hypothetical protein VK148_02030 [Xanthobacteraceae bacterium]|jgi:hypothetical protein|nr:hypothetical protein [Xanthobacteraceae bacterium]